MERKVLKVRMLGAFEMEYENRQISFERNTLTKTNQLLQILLHAGKKGILREELTIRLFGREEVTKPSNSLRATVFRLRKLLLAAGFPEGDEYVHIKRGVYQWTNAIEVKLDAVFFEEQAKEALKELDKELRCRRLEQVCELYQGEFLPQLEEEWARTCAAEYKKLYVQCMNELCTVLKSQQEYEKMYRLAGTAAALYPYDEWEIWQIDSLVLQNKKQEALVLYEKTIERLFQEKGLFPSAELTERMSQISLEMKERMEKIREIQMNLSESEKALGAFYCSYPSFSENYKYIKRIIERTGQSAYLILCTITDSNGNLLRDGERLERFSEELSDAIRSSLRRGDLYTKYSKNQYLILLLDIKQEHCKIVIDRINNCFGYSNRKNYLRYSVSPLNELEEELKT